MTVILLGVTFAIALTSFAGSLYCLRETRECDRRATAAAARSEAAHQRAQDAATRAEAAHQRAQDASAQAHKAEQGVQTIRRVLGQNNRRGRR